MFLLWPVIFVLRDCLWIPFRSIVINSFAKGYLEWDQRILSGIIALSVPILAAVSFAWGIHLYGNLAHWKVYTEFGLDYLAGLIADLIPLNEPRSYLWKLPFWAKAIIFGLMGAAFWTIL